MSHKHLPHLPADKLFPHLDKFKSKAAAEKAAIATSATVEAFGSVWLFTIERAGWRSKEGKHISSIGQLPIKPASSYSAEYLRPIFRPGTNAPLHIHAA
jgi:hypothetical protein